MSKHLRIIAVMTAVLVASLVMITHQKRDLYLDPATHPSATVEIPMNQEVNAKQESSSYTIVSAASVPRRWTAMRFARTKIGGWYVYGGNGPTSYDCSGLVMASYRHAGISLPRIAGDQRSSSKTIAVSGAHVRWGDLVFWGYGHVELFGHWVDRGHTRFVSLGAHHSGTRISYRTNYMSGSVHFEHVNGAG